MLCCFSSATCALPGNAVTSSRDASRPRTCVSPQPAPRKILTCWAEARTGPPWKVFGPATEKSTGTIWALPPSSSKAKFGSAGRSTEACCCADRTQVTVPQSNKIPSANFFISSPYCVTFRFTSSSTNDVCSVESSTPLKKIWIVCPLKLSRLKDFCEYPVAWFRFENVAKVESTVPDEFRICTVSVSNAVVVLLSAVSMCRKNVSVAAVAADGMVTVCSAVSVCVVPYPSSHASQLPAWGGSLVELLITPLVTVQGAGFVDPFSNPGLPRI